MDSYLWYVELLSAFLGCLVCIMVWENLDDSLRSKSSDSSPFYFFGLIACKIWDSLFMLMKDSERLIKGIAHIKHSYTYSDCVLAGSTRGLAGQPESISKQHHFNF
jgi:hypothetical protein